MEDTAVVLEKVNLDYRGCEGVPGTTAMAPDADCWTLPSGAILDPNAPTSATHTTAATTGNATR